MYILKTKILHNITPIGLNRQQRGCMSPMYSLRSVVDGQTLDGYYYRIKKRVEKIVKEIMDYLSSLILVVA